MVLIDALRADFVFDNDYMPFISEKGRGGQSRRYIVKSHPPTVTLPRIKALTSGSIPGFVDVVLNFDSSSLSEDNIITQGLNHGRKIVFYGDDTWIKLFPEHFIRSEGTTSFFVTDYTEVDNNVTRHLDMELSLDDWDIMVLHYLGLDHIGHTVGPHSSIVPPKLLEMDRVVEKIYTSLEEKGERFLMLVCGDHGMSDQGSHGGASDREVLVPAVFLSPQYKKHVDTWSPHHSLLQIDLAPTLSVLMSLPLPTNNLGQVILGAVDGLSVSQKLDTLYLNCQQIHGLLLSSVADIAHEPSYELAAYAMELHRSYLMDSTGKQAVEDVFRSYELAMDEMSSRIARSLTTYDLYSMSLAIILLTLCLLTTSMTSQQGWWVEKSMPAIGCLALSIILILGHMMACTSQSFYSTLLCGWSLKLLSLQCLLLSAVGLLVTDLWSHKAKFITNLKQWTPKGLLECFLFIGTFAHSLSFGASSFVEEEHQTWYHLTITFLLLSLVTKIQGHLKKLFIEEGENKSTRYHEQDHLNCDGTEQKSATEQRTSSLQQINAYQNGVTKREHMHRSSNEINFNEQNQDSKESNYMSKDQQNDILFPRKRSWKHLLPWKPCVAIAIVILLGRLLRMVNQTGNKWLDTPDLGDWLLRPENKLVLSYIVIVSYAVILVTMVIDLGITTETVAFTAGLGLTYLYRLNSHEILPLFFESGEQHQNLYGTLEARGVYAVILMTNLIALTKWLKNMFRSRFENGGQTKSESLEILIKSKQLYITHAIRILKISWVLLMLLLLRTHNTVLVAMVIVQEQLLGKLLVKEMRLPVRGLALLCWWMGQTVFFQQGNSNSLSTVDVSAGYVGLQDYQAHWVGILLFFATYAGPIFWLMTLVQYVLETESFYKEHTVPVSRSPMLDCTQTLLTERLFTLLWYTLIVTSQRYHLFVWTVFSPKLLYEGMLTFVFFVFAMVTARF
ncbi:hypothetical protein DPMN_064067 [Dreissena polymorpha]|uniref:GPI ethanolamine phosphate transferase 2 C-terminal domain-containing protein n=3 Tax=Dreissena polymorpha TaxID=45954 RepID=A0A9D4CBM5_DREPO|nr:hypothetical protein DPMN_064067 [Dreissena polymorpha]